MPSVRLLTRAAGAILAIALAALCVAGFCWRLGGGRWFDVRTPSMGTAAPVGTLLLTRPVKAADVHVGDIVTFRVPSAGEIYTHRVVSIGPNGLRTKGDINLNPDPWTVTDRDLVGRVRARWWAGGWMLRGAPLLLLGLAVTWIVAALVKIEWRTPLKILGSAIAASVTAYVLHPWVGLARLDVGSADPGVAMRVVSTGLLPIRVRATTSGSHARLIDGQVATLQVRTADAQGAFRLAASPSLDLGWWVAIVALCLLPLLIGLVVARLHRADPEPADGQPPPVAAARAVPLTPVRNVAR